MSCNLDHVLYDKRNSTDEEKEQDAYAFAKTYKNNVAGFLSFMCESSFSVKGDFKESWEFIEEDMHSIERYTNLPICLTEEACMQNKWAWKYYEQNLYKIYLTSWKEKSTIKLYNKNKIVYGGENGKQNI